MSEKELNRRNILWPRGKVLGGSSSINGMLYKDEVVKFDNGNFEKTKIRVKDSTGKIWFVDKSILTNI